MNDIFKCISRLTLFKINKDMAFVCITSPLTALQFTLYLSLSPPFLCLCQLITIIRQNTKVAITIKIVVAIVIAMKMFMARKFHFISFCFMMITIGGGHSRRGQTGALAYLQIFIYHICVVALEHNGNYV